MANFKPAFERTLKYEGGVANHPNDPGGLTNSGITLATFSKYYEGGADALLHMTHEQCYTIYRKGFWNKIWGDDINSQSVAELFYDTAVNIGVKRAIEKMQMLLGVKVDGVVGKITLKAINDKNPQTLFNEYHDVRVAYYKQLVAKKPQMKCFLNGWLNRCRAFKFES